MNELQFQATLGNVDFLWGISWKPTGKIAEVNWRARQSQPAAPSGPVPIVVCDLAVRLEKYFQAGSPLGEVPWDKLDLESWTPFQRKVYEAITHIPHGETRTYAWVAERIGNMSATRAVGQALRNNPLPVLIPCHRVVAMHSIGGFMGCVDLQLPELRLKQLLIGLEESFNQPAFSFMAPPAPDTRQEFAPSLVAEAVG